MSPFEDRFKRVNEKWSAINQVKALTDIQIRENALPNRYRYLHMYISCKAGRILQILNDSKFAFGKGNFMTKCLNCENLEVSSVYLRNFQWVQYELRNYTNVRKKR